MAIPADHIGIGQQVLDNVPMASALPSCGLPRTTRSDDVQLAFGELPDGRIVHVADVASGLACGCICPGCKARLVARKGALKEHHFSHHQAAQCRHALESALHKLAKQVLDDRRELLLPEVGAEIGDQDLIMHKAKVHQFDSAVLEHRLDSIVPDVIVQKGKHRLLVEMFVTHRCGPEKIATISEMGIACLEIDLRGLPRGATHDEVAAALLATAPRYWIHNPKIAVAEQRLEERIARAKEEARIAAERTQQKEIRRLDALVSTIERLKIRQRRTVVADSETVAIVCAHGLDDLIGHAFTGDFAFHMSAREWQALIVARFIIEPLEDQTAWNAAFHAKTVFGRLRRQGLLVSGMPDFSMRQLKPMWRSERADFACHTSWSRTISGSWKQREHCDPTARTGWLPRHCSGGGRIDDGGVGNWTIKNGLSAFR